MRFALLVWLTCLSLYGQQFGTPIAVVSAASYGPLVAPDSLATIFGTNLAQTAQAQLDSNGQLPATLGGVTVEVNGTPMPLIYTSPSQINFYLPASVPVGGATVVVRASGGIVGQGQADVRAIAPALFAADGSGRGLAAAQNAVTYAPPPFLIETPEISGDDQRTRLVLYGTGFRAGTNTGDAIHALGKLKSGSSVDIPVEFPVEYAGPAPGFFGLDQLNLVLPPELDGVGTVRLTLFQGDLSSNEVTFDVALLPAGEIHLASFTLEQSSVVGGKPVSGTVALNAPARLNSSFLVNLRSDSNSVFTPVNVTVTGGQVSAKVDIRTAVVSTAQTAHITASTGTTSRTASLRLDPANTPTLTEIRLSAVQVTGGASVTGTALLTNPAPLGGTVVTLKADGSAATVPENVTVLAGQTSATFQITTVSVDSAASVTITGTTGDVTRTAMLTVNPKITLSFATPTAVGGTSVTATINLGEPAPAGGAIVTLRTSNLAAQVPGVVNVAARETLANFTFRTSVVTQPLTITITATYKGEESSASILLTPAGSTTLSALAVSPMTIKGGKVASGQVTLTGPAPVGGVVVSLTSNNSAAQVPPSVTIQTGQSSATFSIPTFVVVQNTTATITATASGQSQTANVTVTP